MNIKQKLKPPPSQPIKNLQPTWGHSVLRLSLAHDTDWRVMVFLQLHGVTCWRIGGEDSSHNTESLGRKKTKKNTTLKAFFFQRRLKQRIRIMFFMTEMMYILCQICMLYMISCYKYIQWLIQWLKTALLWSLSSTSRVLWTPESTNGGSRAPKW